MRSKIRVSPREISEVMSKEDKDRLDSISQRLLQMFSGYGPPPMAPGIVDIGRDAPKTFIAIRGNPDAFGDEVQPGFLTALGGGDVPEAPLHAQTTYRRKALAEWIASPENPLFARVMVNRIWQFHFGSGLVKTSSDFGTRAGLPSHPELLDWLATEFISKGWSMKAMHKLIMTSAAYQRASTPNAAALAKDPANDLLSHFNRRRLEAEEIRDASLQVSGEINLKAGGIPAVPPLTREEMFGMIGGPASNWSVSPDPVRARAANHLYAAAPHLPATDGTGIRRSRWHSALPRRNESTTAPQSLSLLNSGFTMDRARALASKIAGPADAWASIYGRAPSQEEIGEAQKFLDRQITLTGSKTVALAELVRGLLNTNEFLYVD